ncbi:WG repeat-containing protein [Chryseobacterium caseinilyticum]|uniref:WG repeat-containing protein n=1 Tax=Chryseobacterium caseinilyticum TaxID=2771428 RepID=A0ABR8ZD34_9FLAO|nr:WG repeat-containing protein [Chryseobacterium caseinilyticum]MBD8083178.1 WG repeat-containing protein [Chryseobacterium caseinilyticum]
MKNLFFFVVLFFISCNSNSQEMIDLSRKNISYFEKDEETGWIRVNLHQPNKWGFINKDSLVIIPFEYDFLNPFENGLAYAKNNGKEFFITKNNLKLEGDFEAINIFSEGLASARKKQKWGFINIQGQFVIPPQYDKVDYFRPSGLCAVQKSGKWGFINKKGKEIIPIIYPEVDQQMLDTNVIVKKNGKWAVFDNQGKQLADFIYDKIHRTDIIDFSKDIFKRHASTYFENGAALVERNGKFEFINLKAQAAFPNNKFDSATVFDTFKNAIVKRKGKYGMIKTNGEFKIPLEYDFIEPYDTSHGVYSEYYNARKGKIYHILNKELKEIGLSYEPVYNAFTIDDPIIIFKNLKNKFGMVDWQGETLIPFVYDRMDEIEGTPFLSVAIGDSFGIIDEKGQIKIPLQYHEIYPLYDKFDDEELSKKNLFIADNKVININNKVLIDGYNLIVPIFNNHNYFIISKNKKFGIIDVNRKIILPLEYDEISNWTEYGPRHSKFIVKNGKIGLIDHETFKITIPPIYDKFSYLNGLIFAKKQNKAGIINEEGKILCDFIYDEIYPNLNDFYRYDNQEPRIYARNGNAYFQIDAKGKVLKSNLTRKNVMEHSEIPVINK